MVESKLISKIVQVSDRVDSLEREMKQIGQKTAKTEENVKISMKYINYLEENIS